jgi:arylsulfatase
MGAVNQCLPPRFLRGLLRISVTAIAVLLAAMFLTPQTAQGAAGKPNILVIFGDDVGQTDISAYSMGVMGFKTPNIDRIAKEGMLFTDYSAENSCTAGRATLKTL